VGPLTGDRGAMPHFGLKIDVEAVLDDAWLAKYKNVIPPAYRQQAEHMEEVRYSPSIFIPDALIISPKLSSPNFGSTGIFGATWRPLSAGTSLGGHKKPGTWQKSSGELDLNFGLLITAAYIYSDSLQIGETFFLRPGIDIAL